MNQLNSAFLHWTSWGNTTINSLSDTFSEVSAIPLAEWAYRRGSELMTFAASCYSEKAENRVRNFFDDPVSTERILAITKPIENFTCRIGKRQPSKYPCIHFIDQTTISIFQHINDYFKELNQLVELPDRIKSFVKNFSVDHFISRIAQSGGRVFVWINAAVLKAKQIILAILDFVIFVVDHFFQFVLRNSQIHVLGYAKDIIVHARKKAHTKFSDLAVETVEKRAVATRKQIVTDAVKQTIIHTNRVQFKMFIGYVAYSCLMNAHADPFTLKMVAGAAGTYFLWKKVGKPYLDQFYHDFRPNFDPDKSALKKFLTLHNSNRLYYPLKILSGFLKTAE